MTGTTCSGAGSLSTRPVLLLEADDQNHADMEALAAALRQKDSHALEEKALATDHSFSNDRIARPADDRDRLAGELAEIYA